MNWKTKKNVTSDMEALHLQEKYGLDQISAKILARREIVSADSLKFYLEDDISFLNNPFLFQDMESFCDRIAQAMEQKEKVHVFGDRDVDGITSTALLVSELTNMGLEVTYSVPMGDEPYAFSKQAIEKLAQDNISLAITVDCGISCIDEIDYSNSLGIDFLVTDHHIASKELPNAVAIINPKVENDKYPFRDLSGVGVVSKCIWALRFAQTEYYQVPLILLHAFPGNDTVVIEGAKILNLVVTDRICEEVVPNVLNSTNSRLLQFLDCNLPVFVLDTQTEINQLKKAFPKAQINLTELRPNFEKYLGFVKDSTLFSLNSKSRFAIYSAVRSELDTLIGLFSAFVRASNPSLYKNYSSIMDLVAIGTISDLMPMTGENRILVKTGLKVLYQNTRQELIPFLSLQNQLGKKMSATDVSWQISPAMNAAGRMGQPDVAIKMLLSKDQHQTFEYAQNLIQLNKERQKLGEDCWERLYPMARKSYEAFGTKFIFIQDNKIPRGITGILATRFQKAFNCPVMVLTQTKDNRTVGSMRSQKNFNCHDFLNRYNQLFSDFGGHDCAGGFSLDPQNVDELSIRISEDMQYMDCPETEQNQDLIADVTLRPQDFSDKIIKIVEKFEPYGEMNPPLTFIIEGARIENIVAMHNQKDASANHLRMLLSYGSFKWPSVFWGAGQRAGTDFVEGDIVNVAFRMGRNYYKNQELVQLTILDIKRQ